MGQQAFDLLLGIIGRQPGSELPIKNIRLSTELRVRNSTAEPKDNH
jgi:DNA-binding LacI/PurR family transcriptional regulator